MQNDFIRTQLTLINRLARDTKSAHEEDWARFFDLYYPAMVKFAELHGGGEASEVFCACQAQRASGVCFSESDEITCAQMTDL